MQLDYASEAGIWASWLQEEHPEATKVAAITFNNDFGQTYVTGFNKAIEGTDIEVVSQQFHEPTAPDIKNQFTTLAASGADVLLLETTGTFCTQAMAEVEKSTTWKPIVIMSATCTSLTQFFQPLIDQGLTGEGTHEVQYVQGRQRPQVRRRPDRQVVPRDAAGAGTRRHPEHLRPGWWFALTMVNILQEAAKYEGGLDRGNIALAARFIDYNNPINFDGITNQTNGFKDAYLNEGGQMGKYTITDPTTLGTFEPDGELIDNNGDLGNFDDFQAAAGG